MFKSLSFLLIASIFSISQSYAMRPDDRKEQMKRRLQKKLEQKKPEHELVRDFQNLGEILFNTVMEMKPDELCTDHKPVPEISYPIIYANSIDKVCNSLDRNEISEQQIVEVKKTLSLQGRDINQVVSIQENFKSSVESSIQYQKRVNDLLLKETKFHNKIISDFPATEAFAAHVLPFNHKARKELTLPLMFASNSALEIFSLCREPLTGEDLRSPQSLLRIYVGLFQACKIFHNTFSSMSPDFKGNKSLLIKYKRLNSSFYYGEIDLFLKYSNSLLPYVKIVQNVLQIDDFNEVFVYKKNIEDLLDEQRIENQRGPVLLTKYKLFLQERAKKNSQPTPVEFAKLPTPIRIESSSEKQMALPEGLIEEIHSPVNTNEKSKYRTPSEQEMIAERKRQGKEKKKNNAVLSSPKDTGPTNSTEKKTNLPEKDDFFIQIGGGPFKIFNKVMDQSFKGKIEKIILLIEALGGSVDDGRSGSRIKIELPYINSNKRAYLDLLPPENEDESETPHSHTITNTNTTATTSTAESVMHTPQKGKSNKLRFYHTKDVRELLMNAGYTPSVVLKINSEK